MHTRIMILLAVAVSSLWGCASTAERMAKKGIEPLTADELRTTLPGNSVYERGDTWEYTGYLRSDGTLFGRSWWDGGEETATGKWEITDEGLYCRDWDNDWGGGGYGCLRMYRDGDKIVYDWASGSKGKNPTGTMLPVKGNAFDL